MFALSGVSGGSLGVATFATAAMRNQVKPDELAPLFRKYFANDFLSPLIVHLMITEPFRMIFGERSHFESRDRAFEEALAEDWKRVSGNDDFSRAFLEVFCTNYRDCSEHYFPIIWFNSTIVETGLRGLISNISVFPLISGTPSDLLASDLVARRNLDRITVAEAVHLSARFPFISPPATILADVALDDNPNHHEKRLWGHLVDGGYLDNSAADNFLQLVDVIETRRKIALDCYSDRNSDCSTDAIMDVARRLQIIVIVIRNDPLDRGVRVVEIPSLMMLDPDSILAASTPSGYLKHMFLASHLPSAPKSEELTGPPAALAATREARGAVTRQTLAAAMAETSHNSFVEWCRRRLANATSRRRGISSLDLEDVGLTAHEAQHILKRRAQACDDEHRRLVLDVDACERRADFYQEYSLSELLGSEKNIQDCKPLSEGGLRGFALGWTLSSGVQDRLTCVARTVQPPTLSSGIGIGLPTCQK